MIGLALNSWVPLYLPARRKTARRFFARDRFRTNTWPIQIQKPKHAAPSRPPGYYPNRITSRAFVVKGDNSRTTELAPELASKPHQCTPVWRLFAGRAAGVAHPRPFALVME